MSNDCERCNGDGVIHGPVTDLPCPNCRDVCQWCNSEYDDGEPLGETGLSVCRGCIRDMAGYKERVPFQLHIQRDLRDVADGSGFAEAADAAVKDVLASYGIEVGESVVESRDVEYGEVGE